MKNIILNNKTLAIALAAFSLSACGQDNHGHSHDDAPATVAPVTAVIKQSAPAPSANAGAASQVRNDETRVTLKPNQGLEVKLVMAKGAKVDYTWQTVDGVVNHDTHGEPPAGVAGKAHRYSKGVQVTGDKGLLVAAFDGEHGWFWRNRMDKDVTVVLTTKGQYSDLKKKN
jgi:hypothetical protein